MKRFLGMKWNTNIVVIFTFDGFVIILSHVVVLERAVLKYGVGHKLKYQIKMLTKFNVQAGIGALQIEDTLLSLPSY